jgi:hypothetical protein
MTKAQPASKTSSMLQAIGPIQNHMNIKSQLLSLTNTVSPTLILYTLLRIVTARGLILSYLQNKIFMQFISFPCLLERSTSLVLLLLLSPIPEKSHTTDYRITCNRSIFQHNWYMCLRNSERRLPKEALYSYNTSVLLFR